MMTWSCWALLVLLGGTSVFFGWLGLGTSTEELGSPQEEIVMGLRSPCIDLSEEEEKATKLRGDLFNCQASIEGQPCTLDMQHEMEQVMEKLQQINQSLELMLVAIKSAQNQLEKHLQHLHDVLNPTSWSPSVISTCIHHVSYFILLVALLVPTLSHAIILLIFLTFSTLSEFLGIPVLSTVLAFTVAGWWLVVAAHRGAGGAWTMVPQEKPCHQLTSTPERDDEVDLLQEELARMEMSCLQELSCLQQPPVMPRDLLRSPISGRWRTKMSCEVTLEPATGTGKHCEPKPCSPSQSLASDKSLLSPWYLCQGFTRAGQRCRNKATPGQGFCHIHATS